MKWEAPLSIQKKSQRLTQRRFFKPVTYAAIISLVLVLFLERCTYVVMPPWKETDPGKPRFVYENFEYEDYLWGVYRENLNTMLGKLFYLNDSREWVEEVLVDYGGAEYGYYEDRGHCYSFKSRLSIEFFLNVDAPMRSHVCIDYDDNALAKLRRNGTDIPLKEKIK